MSEQAPPIATVQTGDLTLAYRELGSGPPVLLLHGWPTSSYLWREVMRPIAERNRVIALDLPGLGASSKPDASYDFPFFEDALDGFLGAVGVERLSLAVHDLGGPIGVHWAIGNRERVERLALHNTLLYPRPSLAVAAFVVAAKLPLARDVLTSDRVIDMTMRMGIRDPARRPDELLRKVREPFQTRQDRRALAKIGQGLSVKGLREIERALPEVRWPVRVIYGERDRILPDVKRTMARVKRDIPHAEVTALPGCGHFLQEEQPERVGALLGEFFAR